MQTTVLRNRRTIWRGMAAASLVFFIPREALVSGRAEIVTLQKVLQGGEPPTVFVVERAEPFEQTVDLFRQPKPRDASHKRSALCITYRSFRIKEVLSPGRDYLLVEKDKEVMAAPPGHKLRLDPQFENEDYVKVFFPREPGEVIRVVSSRDILNNELERMDLEEGAHKVAIYYELEDELSPAAVERIESGRLYLLFVSKSFEYQSYKSVGGYGLLDIKRKDDIVRLLKKRRS
jgi:hypothetical protein